MANTTRLAEPKAGTYEWQLDAACRGRDTAAFFHPPKERSTARRRRIEEAKAVCHTCPVINECLAHALRRHEPYGIWGGRSENERAAILGVQSLIYPAPRKSTDSSLQDAVDS